MTQIDALVQKYLDTLRALPHTDPARCLTHRRCGGLRGNRVLFEKMRGKRTIALFAGTSAAVVDGDAPGRRPSSRRAPASASWYQLHAQARFRTMKTNNPCRPQRRPRRRQPPRPRLPPRPRRPARPRPRRRQPPPRQAARPRPRARRPTRPRPPRAARAPRHWALGGAWTCTLDDEFNGTSLDTKLWAPQLTAQNLYVAGPDVTSTTRTRFGVGRLPEPLRSQGADLSNAWATTPRSTRPAWSRRAHCSRRPTARSRSAEAACLHGARPARDVLALPAEPHVREVAGLGEIDFAEFYSQYPNLECRTSTTTTRAPTRT